VIKTSRFDCELLALAIDRPKYSAFCLTREDNVVLQIVEDLGPAVGLSLLLAKLVLLVIQGCSAKNHRSLTAVRPPHHAHLASFERVVIGLSRRTRHQNGSCRSGTGPTTARPANYLGPPRRRFLLSIWSVQPHQARGHPAGHAATVDLMLW